MDYNTLKKLSKQYKNLVRYIYISNCFTSSYDKFKETEISIYKNFFCRYVVIKWEDYEYGKYSVHKVFSNKDLAADFAWQLFGGEEEFQRLLQENKI